MMVIKLFHSMSSAFISYWGFSSHPTSYFLDEWLKFNDDKTTKHCSVPKKYVDIFFKEVGNFTLLSRTFVVKECSVIYIYCHRDCAGIRINIKIVGVKL